MEFASFSLLVSAFLVLWAVDLVFFLCDQCKKIWEYSSQFAECEDPNINYVSEILKTCFHAFFCAVSLTLKLINISFTIAIYKNIEEDVFRNVLVFFSGELDIISRYCLWLGLGVFAFQIIISLYALSCVRSTEDTDEPSKSEMRVALLDRRIEGGNDIL